MNENKVPSLEEIIETWKSQCHGVNCEACKLENGSHHPCHERYIHAVLTGKMTLTDSFRKEEPKPELPAWCKKGQWVLRKESAHMPGGVTRIRAVDGEKVYTCDLAHMPNIYVELEDIKPIHFRSYTFEEAKKLLGKVVEFTDPDTKARHLHTITKVYEYEGVGGLEPGLNNFSQEGLMALNATIDGVPIGVPEVDEEALNASHTCEEHEGVKTND